MFRNRSGGAAKCSGGRWSGREEAVGRAGAVGGVDEGWIVGAAWVGPRGLLRAIWFGVMDEEYLGGRMYEIFAGEVG